MSSMITDVDKLKFISEKMQELLKDHFYDKEASHETADNLLIETIEVLQELKDTLVLQEVAKIIDTYSAIDKWYS